jgi:cation diffusion facilitator CzcD-associated flavoprotein CzcO
VFYSLPSDSWTFTKDPKALADHEIDFKGKDVVIVGNGASANQFVPWLLSNTGLRSLAQVVRSPQWVAPKDNQQIRTVQK